MLTLLAVPFTRGGMMGKGNWMGGGGAYSNLFLFYHIVVGLLFLTLLFLAVVYLWKKIEMMDHDKNHHHDHKK